MFLPKLLLASINYSEYKQDTETKKNIETVLSMTHSTAVLYFLHIYFYMSPVMELFPK